MEEELKQVFKNLNHRWAEQSKTFFNEGSTFFGKKVGFSKDLILFSKKLLFIEDDKTYVANPSLFLGKNSFIAKNKVLYFLQGRLLEPKFFARPNEKNTIDIFAKRFLSYG